MLDLLCGVLSPDRVLVGDAVKPYQENCLSLNRPLTAVLFPKSEKEVVETVKIAARFNVRMYTVSGGKNWGYGTSAPPVGGCMLVNLSLMNQIKCLDEKLGIFQLEPGVTQGQLADYLSDHKLDFIVPTTGAGPSGSLIGNALERGFGCSKTEDHFMGLTSIRAVLADGRIYQPAMAEWGADLADGAYKWGVGPFVDGLFAQGNIGIVTAAKFALIRRSECTEIYFFKVNKGTSLPEAVEKIQEMLAGLHNHIGMIKLTRESTAGYFRSDAARPARSAVASSEENWIGFGALHGPRRLMAPLHREIKERLRGAVSSVHFLNESSIRKIKWVLQTIPGLQRGAFYQKLLMAEQLLRLAAGDPSEVGLRIAYRHVPLPMDRPLNPARDGAGIIFYAPVLPLKKEVVERALKLSREILHSYGFENFFTLSTLSDKCAIAVVTIIYRKPEEAATALACYDELLRRGLEFGLAPYRVPVSAMNRITDQEGSVYWDVVSKLKESLDPDGIFSPARYSRINLA